MMTENSSPILDSFTNITVVFPRYNDSTTLRCNSSMTLKDVISKVETPRDVMEAQHIYDSTLSVKRELGPVDECLGQTLSHLQLWPSATIHIMFPGDEEEEWTLVVKSVKDPSDQVKLNFLRAMDKVSLLKKRVASRSSIMTPSTALKLIYGGKILNDDDSLIRCGISSGDTVLCLKVEHQSPSAQQAPASPGPSSVTSPPQPDTESSTDNAIPICRICYGMAEEGYPLITPCRCSGSIGRVHLECLNSWRRLAPTEASFRRCDQCGYEYRFERTRLAEFLLSSTGVWSIAILLCLALLYGGSFLVEHSPERLKSYAIQYSWIPQLPRVLMMGNRRLPIYQWLPETWTAINNHLLYLKGGTFFFGALGFGQYILDEVLHWYIHRRLFGGYFNMHTAMMVMWFCSLHSGEMPRIVVIVGFAGCAHVVAMNAHAKSKELAQWLGERMLAVE